MVGHTPGPWRICTCDVACEPRGLKELGEKVLMTAGSKARANFRLIAAAPELLELAYQYASDLRYPPQGDSIKRRLERIESVIAKVKGE